MHLFIQAFTVIHLQQITFFKIKKRPYLECLHHSHFYYQKCITLFTSELSIALSDFFNMPRKNFYLATTTSMPSDFLL